MPQELLRNFILLFVLSWKNGEMPNCVSHFPAVSLHHVCCKILLFSGKYSPLLTAPFMKSRQPYCIFCRQDSWNEKASAFLAYYNRQLLTHHICLETDLTANAPSSLGKSCSSFLSLFFFPLSVWLPVLTHWCVWLRLAAQFQNFLKNRSPEWSADCECSGRKCTHTAVNFCFDMSVCL